MRAPTTTLLLAIALTACGAPALDRGVPDDGEAHDVVLVVTRVALPPPVDGTALGADLDGRISEGGAIASCEDVARDFVSARDGEERGIDAAASDVLPVAEDVLGLSIEGELDRAHADGSLALAIELRGLRAHGDGAIDVALLADAGDGWSEIAIGRGTIRGATVHARFEDLSIPTARAIPLLPLDRLGAAELVLDLETSAQGAIEIREASLGASLPIDALVADAIGRGTPGAALAADVLELGADLQPSAADPMRCERLSIGLAIDAAGAAR